MSISLGSLITRFGGHLHGGADSAETNGEAEAIEISGIGLDSHTSAPGELFAAMPGNRTHGASFADQTPAAAIITDAAGAEVLSAADESRAVWVVDDLRAVIGEIAAEIYGHPSRDMTVMGVTGTSGKTTTSYILEAGLRAAGASVGLIGTTGTRINGEPIPTTLTTPEAPKLQSLFAQMRDQGVTHVVMEVSSHALALGRVNGTHFAVGGFSNLSQDHLDFHPTMQDYFDTKARLFSGRAAAGAAAIVVDDSWGQEMAQLAQSACHPCLRISTDQNENLAAATSGSTPEVVVSQPELTAAGSQQFSVFIDGIEHPISLPLPGKFNVANAALATTMAWLADIELASFVKGLAAVAVPGRMQTIDAGQDFVAVVDYAHKPAALAAVLETLRHQVGGRLAVVVGAGGDRDQSKRPKMGEVAATHADFVIVTDDNPRSEEPAPIRNAIIDGAHGVESAAQIVECADRADAIAQAISWARAGDAVVVAGKGHETGQIVGETVHPFDDRAEVARALAHVGGYRDNEDKVRADAHPRPDKEQ